MTTWQGGVECRENAGARMLGTLHVTEEELIFVCGGSVSSSRVTWPMIGTGLLLSTFLPVMLLTEPSGSYFGQGGRLPALMLGALGPILVLVGLALVFLDGRARRRALAELALTDGADGAMDLDQQYAVAPGSWRCRLDQVENVWRITGGLQVTTTLEDDYWLRLLDREGLEAALGRKSG